MATDGSNLPLNPKPGDSHDGPLGSLGSNHSHRLHGWQNENCPRLEGPFWNGFGSYGLQRLTKHADRAFVFYLEQLNSIFVLLLCLICILTYARSERTLNTFGWAHAELALPSPWIGSMRVSIGLKGFVRREIMQGEPDTVTWIAWESAECPSELGYGTDGLVSTASEADEAAYEDSLKICARCDWATTQMCVLLILSSLICFITILATRFSNSRVAPGKDSNFKKVRGAFLALLGAILVCGVAATFKRQCFDRLLDTINLPSVRVDGKPAPIDWEVSWIWVLITVSGFIKCLNLMFNVLVPSIPATGNAGGMSRGAAAARPGVSAAMLTGATGLASKAPGFNSDDGL